MRARDNQSNHQRQNFHSNSHILDGEESKVKYSEAIFNVDQEHFKGKNDRKWILCEENLVECPICLQMKALHFILIPCGHAGICCECLEKMENTLDPRIKRTRDKPVYVRLLQTQIVINCPQCRTQSGVFKMHLM